MTGRLRCGAVRRTPGGTRDVEEVVMSRWDAGMSKAAIAADTGLDLYRVDQIVGYLATGLADHWDSAAARSSARLVEAIRRHHPEQIGRGGGGVKIDARITYGSLCRRLDIGSIPDLAAVQGAADPANVLLTIRNVIVDDDDARSALIEKDIWSEELEIADDADALRDLVAALISGDIALARIAGDRLFANERMRLACEQALAAPALRSVA